MDDSIAPSSGRREALLSCEELTIGYNGVPVLENIDFRVFRGDYLYIVGENGSGKSTLMKTILGLIPPVCGRVITGNGLKRNEIGWLPQQTAAQKDFPALVREVVLSGCLNRMGCKPFYGHAEKELATRNLTRLGIIDLADRPYRSLSGGQQQRVLLARALCATRKLIMLDEPVTGLDPEAAASMYSLIASLNREGVTVIMISHDISAACSEASHVLHLCDKKWTFATRDQFLTNNAFAHSEGCARQ